MIRGQPRDKFAAGRMFHETVRHGSVVQQVAVTQDCPFRCSGRTGSILQKGNCISLDGGHLPTLFYSLREAVRCQPL